MPDISVGSKDRNIFYNSFVQTYLQRGTSVTSPELVVSFLKLSGFVLPEPGQILNYADMDRDADMALNTAKSWLSILQASGIVFGCHRSRPLNVTIYT